MGWSFDGNLLVEISDLGNERLREAHTGENRKFISDVISSARLPLTALNRPEVARVFAPDPDTPQPHFREKEVVWVCIPQNSEDIALLAGAIVHNLYNRAVASRRGTYFLVDEAGSTITIENLDRYLQVGLGLGTYFFLVLQDISQLQDKIGAAKTRSILGSAGVQFWGKSQDTETARYVSDLSGRVRVRRAVYEHDGFESVEAGFLVARSAVYDGRAEPGRVTHGARPRLA
jgi:type IV secretory pathway TraG/TraD family ATPase VirD4